MNNAQLQFSGFCRIANRARPTMLLFVVGVFFSIMAVGWTPVQAQDAPPSTVSPTADSTGVVDDSLSTLKTNVQPSKNDLKLIKMPDADIPIMALWLGLVVVLFLITVLKLHAFIGLILGAIVVSLFIPGNGSEYITRVALKFGEIVGNIGIAIAMAAVIAKCMLASGSGDRIVQFLVSIIGRGGAAVALMLCSFLFSIAVIFESVFYLLVPLARSMYQQTKQNYGLYLLAIVAGGSVASTLVPPTPGPLLVSAILGVNVFTMIWVGIVVALPTALIGYVFASFYNSLVPIDVPSIAENKTIDATEFKRTPSVLLALIPILLPIVLISLAGYYTLKADSEMAETLGVYDVEFFRLADHIERDLAKVDEQTPAKKVHNSRFMTEEIWNLLLNGRKLTEEERTTARAGLSKVILDRDLYDRESFRRVSASDYLEKLIAGDRMYYTQATYQRMNRELLRESFPNVFGVPPSPTSMRQWARVWGIFGEVNMALILGALVSLAVLSWNRGRTIFELSHEMEGALSNGALIVLMMAAGGAFGEMLNGVGIGNWIRINFGLTASTGMNLLVAAYAVAAAIKFTQGSSTVAMIVTAGMVSAVISRQDLQFNTVYVALAIGSGSLMGSWMNDSGFWIFAKSSGLTENQTLKSWTVMLAFLSVVSFGITLLLAMAMPLT